MLRLCTYLTKRYNTPNGWTLATYEKDGGYTQAKFDAISPMVNITGGAPTNVAITGGTFNGWFIGGGTEYALAGWFPGLFWKSEYRFSDYSTETRLQTAAGVPTGTSQVMSPTIHTIRSELVWRFNFGRY